MDCYTLPIVYFAYVEKRKTFYPVIQINFETLECIVYSMASKLRFVLQNGDYHLIQNTGIQLLKEDFKTSVKDLAFDNIHCYIKEYDILKTKKPTESGENTFAILCTNHSLKAHPVTEDKQVDMATYIDLDYLLSLDIENVYDSLAYSQFNHKTRYSFIKSWAD